jgi:hypothetical protein
MWCDILADFGGVTSQDVRLEMEGKQFCALQSCIENPGNFCAFT